METEYNHQVQTLSKKLDDSTRESEALRENLRDAESNLQAQASQFSYQMGTANKEIAELRVCVDVHVHWYIGIMTCGWVECVQSVKTF